MANAQKLRQTQAPGKQEGEKARLKVVQGPDYGTVFVLTRSPVVIGRGEDCDVMLGDLKASRMHAELSESFGGIWTLRDLGSANGIMHNGRNVQTAPVKTGDTITVGETILDFVEVAAGTQVLASPARNLAQVKAQQVAFQEQKNKVHALGSPALRQSSASAGRSTSPRASMSRPMSPKRLALLAVGAIGLYMLLDTPTPSENKKTDANPKTVAKKNPSGGPGEAREPAGVQPPQMTEETAQAVGMFLQAGFREYREKNYLRARQNFENALQVVPGHRTAKLYVQNCNLAIDEEVKSHLEAGKKGLASGKLRSAQGHFEAVERLLFREPGHPALAEARENLEKVRRKKKGGSG